MVKRLALQSCCKGLKVRVQAISMSPKTERKWSIIHSSIILVAKMIIPKPQSRICHLRSNNKCMVVGRRLSNHSRSSTWPPCTKKVKIGGQQFRSTSLISFFKIGKRVLTSPKTLPMRSRRGTDRKSFKNEASKWCKLPTNLHARMVEVDWETLVCNYQLSKCNSYPVVSVPIFPFPSSLTVLENPTIH